MNKLMLKFSTCLLIALALSSGSIALNAAESPQGDTYESIAQLPEYWAFGN